MLLVSGAINIPPNNAVPASYSVSLSCRYLSSVSIKVFAFRVHAHTHGDVNSAYRVRRRVGVKESDPNWQSKSEWTELARGNPQWPQTFYRLPVNEDVTKDDYLVGRCAYHNTGNEVVHEGGTHMDEMCNVSRKNQ